MKIVVLASGSKGNATYIETKQTKILIDAGISYLQIRLRLASRGIMLSHIDAIFVTHEHTDHIKHLVSVASKTGATIYLSEACYYNVNRRLNGGLNALSVALIHANCKYDLGDVAVAALELSHDVDSCFGYVFKEKKPGNVTYGYVTDTGYIPEQYLSLLSKIQVLSIESNHDVTLLKSSARPKVLIGRILSKAGHLSNVQCAQYLKGFDYKYMKWVILSHLSEECNTETLALEEVRKVFGEALNFRVEVAKQNEPLEVIEVE